MLEKVSRIWLAQSLLADELLILCCCACTYIRSVETQRTVQALPVNLAAGYAHADTAHTSTELRRFIATHEGVQVAGDFPAGDAVPHTVVRGAVGQPELTDAGEFLIAHYKVTDTYILADHTTYTAERSYAERWPITELTEVRQEGSYERQTWNGSTHWLTGASTKIYTIFHRMVVYQRRIASKPDGTEHLVRDWWPARYFETQGGQRHDRY
jgi:hypothetical protein